MNKVIIVAENEENEVLGYCCGDDYRNEPLDLMESFKPSILTRIIREWELEKDSLEYLIKDFNF